MSQEVLNAGLHEALSSRMGTDPSSRGLGQVSIGAVFLDYMVLC